MTALLLLLAAGAALTGVSAWLTYCDHHDATLPGDACHPAYHELGVHAPKSQED